MKLKEGGFEFRESSTGWAVYYRGRQLGELVTMREVNDRYCFRLGADTRKHPRTYRGRVRAARALQTIDNIVKESKKRGWSLHELVLFAWDSKPATAPRN